MLKNLREMRKPAPAEFSNTKSDIDFDNSAKKGGPYKPELDDSDFSDLAPFNKKWGSSNDELAFNSAKKNQNIESGSSFRDEFGDIELDVKNFKQQLQRSAEKIGSSASNLSALNKVISKISDGGSTPYIPSVSAMDPPSSNFLGFQDKQNSLEEAVQFVDKISEVAEEESGAPEQSNANSFSDDFDSQVRESVFNETKKNVPQLREQIPPSSFAPKINFPQADFKAAPSANIFGKNVSPYQEFIDKMSPLNNLASNTNVQTPQDKKFELERLSKKYELVLAEKIALENEVTQLGKKLAAAETELSVNVERLDVRERHIDHLQAEIAHLKTEIKAKDSLIREIQSKDLQAVVSLGRDKEMKDLQLQLEMAKVKLNESEKLQKAYEEKIEELHKLADEDNLRKEEIHDHIAQLETEIGQKEKKIETLERKLRTSASSDLAGKQLASYENEIKTYLEQNKTLLAENKALKERLTARSKPEKTELEGSIAGRTLKVENSELSKNLIECQKQLELLSAEHRDLKERTSEERELLLAQVHASKLAVEQMKRQLDIQPKEESIHTVFAGTRSILPSPQNPALTEIQNMLSEMGQENKVLQNQLHELKGSIIKPNEVLRGNFMIDSAVEDRMREENAKIRSKLDDAESELAEVRAKLLESQSKVKESEVKSKKQAEELTRLSDIVERLPRNTKDIDFALLEQKLIVLEKEQKMKEFEYQTYMRTLGYSESMNENRVRLLEHEKSQLAEQVQKKDQQVEKLKAELQSMVGEFKKIKSKLK